MKSLDAAELISCECVLNLNTHIIQADDSVFKCIASVADNSQEI
jgi:hypothetical protein